MKYHCIKQFDITDCGAAWLATIAKQYGLKIPITRIREVAGTDKQGTNALGMIKTAEKLGLTAKAVKGDQNAFFSEFPLPCVAHVIVDGTLLHYVVIHKITKKQVIIADPGKGIVKKTPEEFFKHDYRTYLLKQVWTDNKYKARYVCIAFKLLFLAIISDFFDKLPINLIWVLCIIIQYLNQ